MQDETINSLKDKLSALGVSTSTPGLSGKDRHEALLKRLNDLKISKISSNLNGDRNQKGKNDPKTLIIADLSIADLKDRLEALHESSTTPGLSGAERKAELVRRLKIAIVNENEVVGEDEFAIEKNKNSENKTKLSGSPQRGILPKSKKTTTSNDIIPSAMEISEMKKSVTKISNKRAIAIAARLSGAKQDEVLKGLETKSSVVENELITLRRIKTSSGNHLNIVKSSPFIENGVEMNIDKLISKLEVFKQDLKNQISDRRQSIREEENTSAEYGLAVEEEVKSKIRALNLARGGAGTGAQRKPIPIGSNEGDSNVGSIVSTSDGLGSHVEKGGIEAEESYVNQTANRSNEWNTSAARDELMAVKVDSATNSNVDNDSSSTANASVRSSSISSQTGLASRKKPSIVIPAPATKDSKAASPPPGERRVSFGRSNCSPTNNKSSPSKIIKQSSISKIDGGNGRQDSMRSSLRSSDSARGSRRGSGSGMGVSFVSPPKAPPPDSKSPTPMPRATDVDIAAPSGKASFVSAKSKMNEGASGADRPENSRGKDNENYDDDDDDDDDEDKEDTDDTRKQGASTALGSVEDDDGGGLDEDDHEKNAQVKALREHARVLQKIGDLQEAETVLQRALALDPTDVRTLHYFAIFLHRKRGELGRAEAFFRRALQFTMPGLLSCLNQTNSSTDSTMNPPNATIGTNLVNSDSLSIDDEDAGGEPGSGNTRISVSSILRLLLDYASFLCRAKGDMDGSIALYRRAIEVSPQDSVALSSLGHVLADTATSGGANENAKASSEEAKDRQNQISEAEELFKRALKADPNNLTAVGWYAKLLRRTGRLGQADVMYQVAVTRSANMAVNVKTKQTKNLEATALCNYASFVCKHRKDPSRALTIFEPALAKYPSHKGLIRNYGYLLRDYPHLQSPTSNNFVSSTRSRAAEKKKNSVAIAVNEEEDENEDDSDD